MLRRDAKDETRDTNTRIAGGSGCKRSSNVKIKVAENENTQVK